VVIDGPDGTDRTDATDVQGTGGATGGAVLLQGGAEMRPACREMDLELVGLAPPGPVVVLLGAATPGSDFRRSVDRAIRYHVDLLPGRDVRAAPHPQDDLDGCVEAVSQAAVVVLPGGSPSRLHDGLVRDGGRLGAALLRLHRAGAALSGSSAGAMVLCARTLLPDSEERRVVSGLDLLPGLAMVHDHGGDRGWHDPDDVDGVRWGLPEAGGLLLERGLLRGVGEGSARLLRDGASTPLPRTATPLGQVLRRPPQP